MKNIKRYIDDALQVSISSKVMDDDEISAIPLKISDDLLCIMYIFDFVCDGYKVLRIKDITELKRDEVDEFHDYIINKQGIIRDVDRLDNLNVDSWNTVFDYLCDNEIMLDISLEAKEIGKNFFVGKVEKVNDNNIMLREVDAFGEYKKKSKRIYYDDITMISFGNRYSEMLDKYGEKYADCES